MTSFFFFFFQLPFFQVGPLALASLMTNKILISLFIKSKSLSSHAYLCQQLQI
ncbi:hypothetical protein Tsp_07537 [Trichinella spiralis]|uniref:hypothetical protein n=1 Tax=Trichinella spiralis TaxID=6334 RepID=UPI0001EFB3BC|nr:hypothetical protein Tsp_07537 [Trichinella spiralis]